MFINIFAKIAKDKPTRRTSICVFTDSHESYRRYVLVWVLSSPGRVTESGQ